MKKSLSFRGTIAFCILIAIAFSSQIACQRNKVSSKSENADLSVRISGIREWWENRNANEVVNSPEILSRIPDSITIHDYWRSQFQNGIPKWSDVRIVTVNDETIYEVPFQFPDNLILLNDKPDAPPQMYITGKEGAVAAYKTSQTYLVIKEKPGSPNVAEIMAVVLNNSYLKVLDSMGSAYPDIRIHNVYPSPINLGEFSGSVKFFDLNGVQLLEEGYTNGSLNDYLQYGKSNFPITPDPNLSTTRMYSVCTWTYIYQQNCGPDAGCTDWELIGVTFNGCETITSPDSAPVTPPQGGGSTGGGATYTVPPIIHQNPPIPNADLCGNYKWTPVGDALYCQIRNLGMTVAPVNPGGGIPQTFTLGLTCVHVPKWFVGHGYDITGLVNAAFNEARKRIMLEVNSGALPVSAAVLQPKFEEYMKFYFQFQPNGIIIYPAWGRVIFRNGCDGDIPISQPKWCVPQ